MDYYASLFASKVSGGGGGGGSAVLINKNINANGTYNASSDNADGYKKVVVDVPNPSAGTLSITANDTYDVTDYASVEVDVPTGITPSGTKSITANGTYDVTTYESADVDVPVGWTSDGIAQNLEPNGAVTLSGSVSSIAKRAFMLKPITSISGSEVTFIDDSAFEGCSSLASVSFPSLVEIKAGVFRQCTSLQTLSLPSLTTLGIDNIRQCANLVSVSIPNAAKLPSNTFYDNGKMTSVDVSSVTETANGAFQQCYALEFLDFPMLTKIGASTFYNTRKLSTLVLRSQNVVTLDNVNAFTNTAITGYNSGSGTIYVPSSLISSYQTASNWSNIYGQGHVTFAAIEGSAYE